MESYGRCLFLSGFFHSVWFMLLCVSVVHSFVLLSSIPSSLPFSLCWFYSFSAAWLSYVEGSLACGTPKVYLLRLLDWFRNFGEGLWLVYLGSDAHLWAKGLWLEGQGHMKNTAKLWESSECVWFQPSAHVGTPFWPSSLPYLPDSHWNCKMHYTRIHSKWIK